MSGEQGVSQAEPNTLSIIGTNRAKERGSRCNEPFPNVRGEQGVRQAESTLHSARNSIGCHHETACGSRFIVPQQALEASMARAKPHSAQKKHRQLPRHSVWQRLNNITHAEGWGGYRLFQIASMAKAGDVS